MILYRCCIFVEDAKPISVLEQFGFTIVFPWEKKAVAGPQGHAWHGEGEKPQVSDLVKWKLHLPGSYPPKGNAYVSNIHLRIKEIRIVLGIWVSISVFNLAVYRCRIMKEMYFIHAS